MHNAHAVTKVKGFQQFVKVKADVNILESLDKKRIPYFEHIEKTNCFVLKVGKSKIKLFST